MRPFDSFICRPLRTTFFGPFLALLLIPAGVFPSSPSVAQTTSTSQLKPLNVANASKETGYAYVMRVSLGTAADTSSNPTASKVLIYENGRQIGPAHSLHKDIRTYGKGRFSHWKNDTGIEQLYFSSSDNTDPRSNGRTYSYSIGPIASPAPTPGPTATATPAPTPTPTASATPAPSPTLQPNQINVKSAVSDTGYAYLVNQKFGTPADSLSSSSTSKLVIYENGRALGPAHSLHKDIRTYGQGRYSHWQNDTTSTEQLYFSASDNTDPRTNGRVYTFSIGSTTSPTPTPSPTATAAPTPTPTATATPTPTPTSPSGPSRPIQGAGSASVGGRGGRIIAVTNLNDSGSGSLREAMQASGPRIIVFRVSGTITLNSHIYVSNPFMTIAGQTAPGGGILIRGSKSATSTQLQSLFYIETNDVVIQYLRMRLGYNPNFKELNGKDIVLADNVRNFVLDHCSLSWAQDKNFSLWPFAEGKITNNVTLQWNLFSEPIYANGVDGTGVIAGGNSETISANVRDIDFHHNFFASNRHRNPLFKGKNTRIVSNLIYNWQNFGTGWEGGATLDIINNRYERGPVTSSTEIAYRPDGDRAVVGNPSIYIMGNMGPSNSDPSADNWRMIEVKTSWQPSGQAPSTSYRRTTQQPVVGVPITATPARDLESVILPEAGASRRLDADGNWVAARDSVDTRVVQEYWNRTGKIISSEDQVGGYPVIASGTPYTDTDGDGMPDRWEFAHGLNPNDASDGPKDSDGDGLTNVEEFLNGTTP